MPSPNPATTSNHTPRLSDFMPGEYGRVVAYRRGDFGLRGTLLAMGLTPGTTFRVVRIAPLGDPVEIQVRGSSLTLRSAEAAVLMMERVEP